MWKKPLINAEQAVEKALEIMKKSGWTYVLISEVFQEGGYWIVTVDTLIKKLRIKIDSGGNILEIREIKPS